MSLEHMDETQDAEQDVPELPPEPLDDDAEKASATDIEHAHDISGVKRAMVRSNNRLYEIDPKEILTKKEYKWTLVTIDGPNALVDLDKHKIRPFLLSILGQYNILPELKKLDQIWMIAVFSAILIFAGFFINSDKGAIKDAKAEIIKEFKDQKALCQRESGANQQNFQVFGGSGSVNRKLEK